MSITNVQTQYIPGFDNPMTSFKFNPGDDSENSSGTKSFRNIQFINSAGDGYGAHSTNFGDIADKIPPKPSLKASCEKCRKRPDQEGPGYSVCSSCKVSRYCSRECQTSHWKEHKRLCKSRVSHLETERKLEAAAIRDNGPFVSQAALRKWYYDNIDIVDYTIVQTLELYKGRAHNLWRTHAVVFSLTGGKKGTSVAASFHDAEAASWAKLARPDTLKLAPEFLRLHGAGVRVVLIFILNGEDDMLLIESQDLPAEDSEEWAGMERDEMWRMHIRMRKMAKMMLEKD
ncbi:hypothetical protein DFH08DRAFT_1089974 [Mycena albidolilacea]|uniref:MYND-type domain-containing protein n=1 Tax=Mycena albidolilacea TaxID=1033008 RepID=A0AAD7E7M9_9AGAR|nr:hypothetical protein DFH08DRAFT_1089974 [Mycena albidolilacea]